jgi:hypothetical protein
MNQMAFAPDVNTRHFSTWDGWQISYNIWLPIVITISITGVLIWLWGTEKWMNWVPKKKQV